MFDEKRETYHLVTLSLKETFWKFPPALGRIRRPRAGRNGLLCILTNYWADLINTSDTNSLRVVLAVICWDSLIKKNSLWVISKLSLCHTPLKNTLNTFEGFLADPALNFFTILSRGLEFDPAEGLIYPRGSPQTSGKSLLHPRVLGRPCSPPPFFT